MGRTWRGLAHLGVIAFTLWAVYPFLSLKGWVFGGALSGDYLRGAWLYDFTARSLAETGHLPYWFTDFGYPEPISRQVTLPNVVDAAMAAPLAWLSGWPKQLSLTMALAIAWGAFGLAWLARSLGCRGLGVLVAGCLGAASWPLWREMHIGRMNDAWVGIAFAALAAFVDLARHAAGGTDPPATKATDPPATKATDPPATKATDPPATKGTSRAPVQSALIWGWRLLLAGGLGAAALAIYPPYTAMLVPPGAVMLWPHLRRRPVLVSLALGAALTLGLALAWPELAYLLARSRTHHVPCANLQCPKDQWFVEASRLFALRATDGGLWMPWSGAALGSWLLLPLALVSRRRANLSWLLLCVAGGAALALGPCPAWLLPRGWTSQLLSESGVHLTWFWCALEPVHDYGRFLIIALGLSAVMAGLGVEAVARRGKALAAVALLLSCLSVGHAAWVLREGTFASQWWLEVKAPVTARFLLTAQPGVVAELPWDDASQYLSVLSAPGSPRINPLQPTFAPESRQPFVQWLHQLSRGQVPDWAPSQEQVTAVGVRWLFFDPGRCTRRGQTPMAACSAAVAQALRGSFGEPAALEEGVLVWQLGQPGSGVADGASPSGGTGPADGASSPGGAGPADGASSPDGAAPTAPGVHGGLPGAAPSP